MYADIKHWVSTCIHCAMKKSPPQTTHIGRLHTIPVGKPWEMVGVDTVGPLPLTERKNQYLTAFTDHFTKWVEVFATPRANSLTMAKLFVEEIICRHGAPQKLLSDRGAAFLSRMSRHLYRLLNVRKVNTSAYHPQTDGLNERYNKTVIIMLSMYVSDHQKDWDVYLPYVRFAYNTSLQSSTGETPFFLMHGRDAVIPLQVQYAHMDMEGWQPKDYRHQVIEGLQQVFQKVRYFNDLKRQSQESYQDEWKRDSPYQVGDLVWVYTPSVQSGRVFKLSHPWRGPFRITHCPTPVTVKVHNLAGKTVNQQIHVSRLKPYNTPDEPTIELPIETIDDGFHPNEEEAFLSSTILPDSPEEEITLDDTTDLSSTHTPSPEHHTSEEEVTNNNPINRSKEDHSPFQPISTETTPSSTTTTTTHYTRSQSRLAHASKANLSAPKDATSAPKHMASHDKGKAQVSNEQVPKQPAWPEELPPNINLPQGWRIEKRVRKSGKSIGNVDYYYFDPNGKQYRSQVEVQRALQQKSIK